MIRELSVDEVEVVSGGCESFTCRHVEQGTSLSGIFIGQMREIYMYIGHPGYGGSPSTSGEGGGSSGENKRTGNECTEEGFYTSILEEAAVGAGTGLALGIAVSIVTMGTGAPSIPATTAYGALGGAAHGAFSHIVGCW